MQKEERSKQGHTNNKAKQHSTPKAVTFLKENELAASGGMYTLIIVIIVQLVNGDN